MAMRSFLPRPNHPVWIMMGSSFWSLDFPEMLSGRYRTIVDWPGPIRHKREWEASDAGADQPGRYVFNLLVTPCPIHPAPPSHCRLPALFRRQIIQPACLIRTSRWHSRASEPPPKTLRYFDWSASGPKRGERSTDVRCGALPQT